LQGSVRRVVLVIKEATVEAKPLERFVFDFEWLIKDRDVPKLGDDYTHALLSSDRRPCLIMLV
jgi:hypothetical protein